MCFLEGLSYLGVPAYPRFLMNKEYYSPNMEQCFSFLLGMGFSTGNTLLRTGFNHQQQLEAEMLKPAAISSTAKLSSTS